LKEQKGVKYQKARTQGTDLARFLMATGS